MSLTVKRVLQTSRLFAVEGVMNNRPFLFKMQEGGGVVYWGGSDYAVFDTEGRPSQMNLAQFATTIEACQ